jgi:dihydrodipicolinate synthase/N-acetylneuraminate lyase
VDTPLYYHSNRGLFLHYRNLSSLVEEPWMLHNDPELIMKLARSLKRNNLRTAILKRVAGIEAIQGLVFLGPLERAGNYQKAVRRRPEFRIYDGDELHFLNYPSMSGIVSAGANLAPKAWRKITDASLNLAESRHDYPDQLKQLWETGLYLQKLLEAYSSFPVPVIKDALSKMGIIETTGVENLQPPLAEIEEAMKAHGDWES